MPLLEQKSVQRAIETTRSVINPWQWHHEMLRAGKTEPDGGLYPHEHHRTAWGRTQFKCILKHPDNDTLAT